MKNQKIDFNDLENKNFILDISGMNSLGQGVGKIDGLTIFIAGAITGEKVDAKVTELKKNYCIGKINKIIEPSPHRTVPFCEVFDNCGGCSLQHISYDYQLEYKTRKVRDEVERISGINNIKVNEIIGMENPLNYRNKAEYFINTTAVSALSCVPGIGFGSNGPGSESESGSGSEPELGNDFRIGFYSRGSHEVVEHKTCHICTVESNEIKNYFKGLLSNNTIFNLKSLTVRKSFGADEAMVIISAYENKNPNNLIANPAAVSGQAKENTSTYDSFAGSLAAKFPSIKSIYLSKIGKHHSTYDLLLGKKTIRENLSNYDFDISPGSFFQVNTKGAEILFDAALKYAGLVGSEEVLDLYCGTGASTILIAGHCKIIIGVEVLKGAVDDAKANARLNGANNVGFIQGETLKMLRELKRKNQGQEGTFDAAIIDPPRTGMEAEAIEAIANLKINKIVYISCNPSTLARDIKKFSENGYFTTEIQPVDMFPHTEHVECVALISRAAS
jgi:23S rRNA (uracil1939-C5)-methyltransferase